MITTPLNHNWKVTDTAPGAGAAAAFSRPGLDTSVWLAIPVPGDVNAALVAAGRMPDPHFGDNARRCYWVTARDWWYRLEFREPTPAPGLRRELCLDGVDGFADLWLNGEKIARLENAFRPYRIEVGDRLKAGEPNVLLLRFQSVDSVLGGPREDELGGWGARRTRMRKPQFSFGWDWSLPLPSLGLAGGARIERHAGPRLLDVSARTFASGRVDFSFRVNTAARDAGGRVRLRITGPGFSREEVIERPGRVNSYTTVRIPNPKLWWPNGLGKAALYDYEALLEIGGSLADRRAGRFGLRESRIVEEPFTPAAGPGFSFWLELNGRRVFCKGANWVPLGIWPGAVGDEPYRFYLRKAAEAGFNMLRVWGGGIYERDLFYDLCDELGIMVWQDFMFASAAYPLERLRDEIIAEAEHQIRRLRSRPCLALWCGCNEDTFSWALLDEQAGASADTGVYSDADPDAERRRWRDDPQLYSMILRGLVGRHGLGAPYVESSPQSREDAGNMPESGNCHISCWKYGLFETGWDQSQPNLSIWERFQQGSIHPEKFRGHFEKTCSFDSEFCIQGPCAVRSLEQFLPPEHRWPPDDLWTFHIQRGHAHAPHHEQTLAFAEALFGPVNSLRDYVKFGQAVHAEMMRAEFESARRDRPNNGGTMMWMFNDCWPTSNWSIIDYYRRPKPAYYAAKRACAALLPIVFERGGRIEFFLSNDGPAPCRAEVRFGQAGLDGAVCWERRQEVRAGAGDTVRFHAIPRTEWQGAPGEHLFIEATPEDAAPLPRVYYFPGLWKDIAWPEPGIRVELVSQAPGDAGWRTELDVCAKAYARFCHVLPPDEAGFWWADDNFFDLGAGGRRRVTIRSERSFGADAVAPGHWLTDWP